MVFCGGMIALLKERLVALLGLVAEEERYSRLMLAVCVLALVSAVSPH